MGKLSEPIKSSIFTLLQHLGYEKASTTLKLFIKKKQLICLFPINIRDFKPKKAFFAQKQGKNGGKQTKPKIFLGKQTKWKLLANIHF